MIKKVSGMVLEEQDFILWARTRKTALPEDLRDILEFLTDLKEKTFFLTGSFSEINGKIPNDLDFFTRNSPFLRRILRRKGFIKITGDAYYADPLISAIFRYESDSVRGISHIDIQFISRTGFKRKIFAQGLFERLSPFFKASKAEKKKIWEVLLTP